MKDDILKLLHDIREASLAIFQFVHGKTFNDYGQDELLQSGVERNFKLLGKLSIESRLKIQ